MKQSVKGVARQAKTQDDRARKHVAREMYEAIGISGVATNDSFVNFAHKLGVGADNPLSFASYGYNPLTRNRQQLEWIHRGSWLGGVAVDLIADDMTRAGADISSEMEAQDSQKIETAATTMGIWDKLNLTIKWGRLYGGCVAVMLIDGQDMKTPLRLETVREGQFKGLCVLDRWMLEPSLGDLVTEFGPDLGLPKYYKVQSNAPALRGVAIHHSRLALRHVGVDLPYQQMLTENLWGISILERLYDRMIAYDSASTGAAQLVYRAFMRTFKIKDMRSVVAAGGAPLDGLTKYVDLMRRYQGIEGISMIDADDEFEVQGHSAFSGLSEALNQFAQQISGALQIPLVRLLGQSPGGLNSSGDSDLRTYYDGISQQQQRLMYVGVTNVYKLLAQSCGVKIDDDFDVKFASLWQLSDKEKADVSKTVGETVQAAVDGSLIGRRTALLELRQSSRATGVFTNITSEQIEAADDEVLPPASELATQGMEHEKDLTETQLEHQSTEGEVARKHAAKEADKGRQHQAQMAKLAAKNKPAPGGRERKPMK